MKYLLVNSNKLNKEIKSTAKFVFNKSYVCLSRIYFMSPSAIRFNRISLYWKILKLIRCKLEKGKIDKQSHIKDHFMDLQVLGDLNLVIEFD